MIWKKSLLLGFVVFLTDFVSAHCPLCTIGAGAAAGAAVWFGVSKVVIGLFMGAFAMSMGLWFARWADKKKRIIPFQKTLITGVVFVTTILPLLPIFSAIGPLYVPFLGDYGRTFALDYSLISSLLGAGVVFVSPKINRRIKDKRNGKGIPFQNLVITFSLLGAMGVLIQVLI